uniref:Uncharacterized protein DDB_G0287625-like n=1 Tax=Dermatophagoides pteronyssinus TaxID=6956 RepID=A0A6P6XLF9_DERPT|nr:uncharacterized protein DDB_G0287625-like [Dermatophagoides pteronyssinus]
MVMYSMNSLAENHNNIDDDDVVDGHHSIIRPSLSDSDLIASSSSNNQNTISLSRDLQVLILDEINNHNDNDDNENSTAIFQPISDNNNDDDNKSVTKSMKNLSTTKKPSSSNKFCKSFFMIKKRKWISTPMGFLTNHCCLTRTDSITDLQQQQQQSSTNNENCQLKNQRIVKHMDQQTSRSINNINDNNDVVDDELQYDHNLNGNDNDDDINVDAHRVNIEDDLAFMDNFPPLNQPLSRLVSLRRRHPNTPMTRSPEPPPLPIHPFPVVVVLPGFSNSYLHHPHISSHDSHLEQQQQQDHNNSSISSINPNSGASSSSDDNISVDGQQQQQPPHSYEPYSIQMPIINHIPTDPNNMNRSTSLSTPTFHTQIDYINCLVPDLLAITNRSFYWGKMDRYEAERLLDGKPEGTFLLRDSAQEDHLFSVSFRRFERSLHARIENWEHRFSFDSHDPGVFSSPTVTGLIEHYKVPSHCMFFEPVLTKPLNRTFTFSLQHLARVTICDRVSYDSINRLPLPQILKSYLKEYHYRIKVRTRHFDESSLYRWLEPNHHHHNQQQPRVYFHQ